MKRFLLPLLMLLPTGAAAQFNSARPLIPTADSRPVPGIPYDGLWTHEFKSRTEAGYIGAFEHKRLHWAPEKHGYAGFMGMHSVRILPLTESRTLIEYDRDASHGTRAHLMEWVDGSLHFFNIDTEAGSKFESHLRSAGASLTEGEFDGDRDRILDALKSWPLTAQAHDYRLRRPSHDEMALVWSYFELENWVEQQVGVLDQTQQAFDNLQQLGNLHLAHKFVSNANYGMIAKLDPIFMSPYEYGRYQSYDFERFVERASKLEEALDKRLEQRMEWISENVEILGRAKTSEASDYSFSPNPGHRLKVHVVATRGDGVVLVNTRESQQHWAIEVLGDIPEGIQFGLRTMTFDEVFKLRLPPHFAFGAEHGPVDVELEIIQGLPSGLVRPPLHSLLSVKLEALEFTETPSGLRYRDLLKAEGDGPKRGNKLKIRTGSWNAAGTELSPLEIRNIVFGSEELPAGVNEALATLPVGGQRIAYLPKHLAEQSPTRIGIAQAVYIEVISRRE